MEGIDGGHLGRWFFAFQVPKGSEAGVPCFAALLKSIDQVLYGVFDQLPEEQAQTIFHFECDETDKTYDIQAETFDLTALIQDLQEDEEFEFEEFEFLDDPRGE